MKLFILKQIASHIITNKIIEKMKIKMDKKDYVLLGGVGAIIYSVGLIPTAIVAGLGYHYRDVIKKKITQWAVEGKIDSMKTTFKTLFRK